MICRDICRVGVVVCASILTLSQAAAAQEPTWFSHYLEAKNAGEVSICTALVNYNNAMFGVRLYGENMDFIYLRDDFTLPYGQTLGLVTFVIDGQKYDVAAFSFEKGADDSLPTAQKMQLIARTEDYQPLLSALRYGTQFDIVFPNGDSYTTTLRGSDKALAAASNCWTRNKTGPIENNPFGAPAPAEPTPSTNNPFKSL